LFPQSHWFLTAVLAATTAAWAVRPGAWVHQNEADFSAGQLENSVVTNLGDVQLARAANELAKLDGDDSIVYDLARLGDGRVILAIGPTGKLVELDAKTGKVTPVAEYKNEQVFCLAADKQGLWVGVSGTPSKLELRSGRELKVDRTIDLPETRYLWDIALDDRTAWLATGAEGKVIALNIADPGAKPVVALDTKQKNVLCLGVDDEHRAYAGTDGEGLVYRITPLGGGTYDSFVLYDAAEPEIGALLVLEDGTVYAGTADAEQAKPGRLEAARNESKGRIEVSPGAKPEDKPPGIPPKPEPKPGDKPDAGKAAPTGAADAPRPDAPMPEGPKADAVADAAKPPTAEQYDQLRDAVRQRLEQARQGSAITLQNAPRTGGPSSSSASRSRPRVSSTATTAPRGKSKQGNAIYRIDSAGFVREVFRESVMILRIAQADHALLVATGNEGEFYRVDPDAEEVTLLANLEPQQVPAMLQEADGQVLVGTANPGRVLRLSDRYAPLGTLTSVTLDAQQISQWGKFTVAAVVPPNTSIALQTRSGNVNDPEAGGWSDWSAPRDLGFESGRSAYAEVTSPAARFLQYRLQLKTKGKATPSVQAVSLKYLMPNLKPRINGVKADFGPRKTGSDSDANAPRSMSLMKVEWELEDANGDKLRSTVEARPVDSDGAWLKLADDLEANNFDWDTRTMPDGRYVLRITASDYADNAPGAGLSASRRSDPVTVDNTPPTIRDVAAQAQPDRSVRLKAVVQDELTPITEIRYNLDSGKTWQLVLPVDRIYDSTNESIEIKIPDLSPGQHVLTIRATDSHGNSRYLSQPVVVGPAEKQ
jgi:hypothetical protein